MFDNKNIKIYNSLTNQLEEFRPIIENEVSMSRWLMFHYPHPCIYLKVCRSNVWFSSF